MTGLNQWGDKQVRQVENPLQNKKKLKGTRSRVTGGLTVDVYFSRVF